MQTLRASAMAADDPLRSAMAELKRMWPPLVLFSLGINLLMLTSSIYMMQVFDRVLSSRNVETLTVLTAMAVVALAAMAALEVVRSALLRQAGRWLAARLARPLLAAAVRLAARRPGEARAHPLRDLEQVRGFLTGPSIFPLLDAPWAPIFLGAMFLLHPWLGWMATAGALVLFVLAVLNEGLTRSSSERAGRLQHLAMQQKAAALRNAEAIEAMGMLGAFCDRWQNSLLAGEDEQEGAGRHAAAVAAAARFVRLLLQMGVLGLGAFLVIREELSPGAMLACSVLMGRALAPVEQAIATWKGVLRAREAFARLTRIAPQAPRRRGAVELPRPKGRLQVDGITVRIGSDAEPILQNVAFRLEPGESLGIIGPSGSGKTTLARLLVGAWEPTGGRVLLDGTDVARWESGDRGQHVGYLPQDVELFAGTVAENIARFRDPADGGRQVIDAAMRAGAHEMIKRLANGYDTEVGEGGAVLSGGQRQRIAFARALFGAPSVCVLDEPNSSLDREGEDALFGALAELKRHGTTVAVIAHRQRVLEHVDRILVLRAGRVEMFGAREDVLRQLGGRPAAPSLAAPAPAAAAMFTVPSLATAGGAA